MYARVFVLALALAVVVLTGLVLYLVKENDELQTKVDDLRRELNFAIRGD